MHARMYLFIFGKICSYFDLIELDMLIINVMFVIKRPKIHATFANVTTDSFFLITWSNNLNNFTEI